MKSRAFRIALCATLLAITATFCQAGQIAASIEYETVARPAGLPEDFQPEHGSSLQFLAIKALDGFRVDAVLWQPEGKPAADTTLVVLVHGSGDNYAKPPNSFLGRGLASKGYAALAINTRQHDTKVNTENFFDVRRDIEAAVQTGRALGYRRIVLSGHSLGNIQVQFFAATTWDPDIKGVLLLGPFGNLPWKTRNLLVQNEDNFKALCEASMKSLKAGTLGETLPIKMHTYTGQDVAVTGQHFLTYRWEQSSVADGTFWIRRIPQPILMVRDQADGVIQPFEPYMLLSAAHAEGSLVSSIQYIVLPDAKPPSLQGHSFYGNAQPLLDTVVGWLRDQHL